VKHHLALATDLHTRLAGIGLGAASILALILKYGPRVLEVLTDIENQLTRPATTDTTQTVSTHA
jgi:hypothetical protein